MRLRAVHAMVDNVADTARSVAYITRKFMLSTAHALVRKILHGRLACIWRQSDSYISQLSHMARHAYAVLNRLTAAAASADRTHRRQLSMRERLHSDHDRLTETLMQGLQCRRPRHAARRSRLPWQRSTTALRRSECCETCVLRPTHAT